MEIIHEQDGVIFVVMEAEIVASKIDVLRKTLLSCIDDAPSRLVIDLTNTNILDSSGIGLLISARNSLAAKNGEVVLRNCNANILRMLKLMRLDKRFIMEGI